MSGAAGPEGPGHVPEGKLTLSFWWNDDGPTDTNTLPSSVERRSEYYDLDGPSDLVEEAAGSGGSQPVSPNCGTLPVFQMASTCGICKEALGKRRFRPRHHCRLCGLSVCAKCSSNKVTIPNFNLPQRACASCVGLSIRAPELRSQLNELSSRLHSLEGQAPDPELRSNLEDAISFCEAAIHTLDEGGSHHSLAAAQENSPGPR